MQIPSRTFPPPAATAATAATARPPQPPPLPGPATAGQSSATREAFHDFVGQTMFGEMLASMRKTVDKSAYFHGGRGEEIFQSQLDQVLVEKITEASAESFADPMYELFTMRRG